MEDIQATINKINKDNNAVSDFLNYLDSSNILIKSNAIMSLLRQKCHEDIIIEKLKVIAEKTKNESRVFGAWTNAHFAIAALYLINTKKSLNIFASIMETLSDIEQKDLKRLIAQLSEI